MGRIRLMPQALANQIAAGEVVERPASVVKELTENSLDAGARSISILIERSGKDLIRVADDGIGMSVEDARLALERHATSKLFDATDLSSISSLGFRGEALPSIASVSRFTLKTRESSADTGLEIEVDGGRVLRERQLGLPPGTIAQVERLFFNVPVRRKFLRADVTEASHIAAQVASLAACYPDVGFRLEHGKRSLLEAPSVATRRQRLYQLEKSWVESVVVLEEEMGGLTIEAWLAPPAEARGAVSRLHLFVNGRPVKDRVLHHAVMEAYRQVSSRSGTPLVYLFLELAPDKVDVNVHPAKSEVRFADQQFVHQAVFSTLKHALSGQLRAPEVKLSTGGSASPPAYEPPPLGPSFAGETMVQALLSTSVFEMTPAFAELAEVAPTPMGQFRGSFIVATDATNLWLIDQHAAHERILYEDIVERGVSVSGQQLLLTPLSLELTPPERVTMEEELSNLLSFGYDIEPFGGDGYLLRAVPPSLIGFDPLRLIRAALSERERECRSSTVQDAESRIAARIACHAAIKVNYELTLEKMQYLVRELWRARQPSVCPHGRPTTLRMGWEQIERGFGRI
ncbi:MAG: DNA mismatch repair endonuclease MutL [Vicinamibacteria bacterium]